MTECFRNVHSIQIRVCFSIDVTFKNNTDLCMQYLRCDREVGGS